MIEVQNLVKRYSTVTALNGVSFNVKKGEVVGFLGPNGAGKSTTMRIITGYLFPDEGTVKVGEYDVLENPVEVKKQIGYLAEDNPLYPEMKVKEFLDFTAELRGLTGKSKKEAISQAVEKTGIKDKLNQTIGTLSKGYRQRVGLAQSLLHNPEVLIMDEPTIGLDPAQIVEIRKLIKELGKEKTVILSTHILPEVQMIADRVIIIYRGKIVGSGTIEELTQKATGGESIYFALKEPAEKVERVFSETPWIEEWHRVEEEDGIIRWAIKGEKGKDIRENLYKLAVEKNWRLIELWKEKATLEEVFLNLTTEE